MRVSLSYDHTECVGWVGPEDGCDIHERQPVKVWRGLLTKYECVLPRLTQYFLDRYAKSEYRIENNRVVHE